MAFLQRPNAAQDGAPGGAREETRAQLRVVVGFVLGALLIGLPLYLWRRPRMVPADPVTTSAADGGASLDAGDSGMATDDGGSLPTNVTVGAARVLECHDQGSAKTSPAECDHPKAIEAALTTAIFQSGACAHGETGTIGYDVDVSFLRKRNPLEIAAPHDDRTIKSAKTAKACVLEVKKALLGAIDPDGGTSHPSLASVMATEAHAHGRYKLAITASYAAP